MTDATAAPSALDVGESITALLPRLIDREVSAETLLEACRSRIEAHDRRGAELRAMLALRPAALDDARGCDRRRAAGEPCGALHGVPIVLKDNIDVVDMPTTSGSVALHAAWPRRTAPVVTALQRAGAVIVGKTNLSELSFEIRCRSSLGGDTRNAFVPGVTSGGSSGGAAVAVAAGFAVAAIGTDTGGSIRVPAAYNSLVGLRPTHGSLSMEGIAPLAPSTDTVGPIARSVDDAARLFGVLTGDTCPEPEKIEGLRIGVLRDRAGKDADVASGLQAAIAALMVGGVQVLDVPSPSRALLPVSGDHIVDLEFGPAFDRYLRDNFRSGAPHSLAALIASGAHLDGYAGTLTSRARAQDAGARARVLARHRALTTALRSSMREHGLAALAYPPSAVLPTSMDNPKGGWAPELAACSGWPALVIPVGRAANGIPLSIELLAPRFGEQLLFALGRAIEDRVGPRSVPVLVQ